MAKEFEIKITGSGSLKDVARDLQAILNEIDSLNEEDIEQSLGEYETERPNLMLTITDVES